MASHSVSQKDRRRISDAVAFFSKQRHLFEVFAKSLTVHLGENKDLAPYLHFIKYRVKEARHLRRKLELITLEAKRTGRVPRITAANLFTKIYDLAGVRILHLHTEQIAEINRIILAILKEHQYRLIEGPIAVCWDVEYEDLFRGFGIKTEPRRSMYTSVHYIIEANQQTKITAELQVRTLMDEVWGEVSHRVNYPDTSASRACREQLKVLARFTSGCTRLVDSIFRSHAESSGKGR
jgi:ppGpp synthetase/RelA/SpoT-type nucleotidyltranferase